MKVILLQDVAKIGRRHDVVEVPDGYARNKLIPTKMAEPATPGNIKRLEKRAADKEANHAEAADVFTQLLTALRSATVQVPVELNDQDHAFKALTAEEVYTVLKDRSELSSLSIEMIEVPGGIKEAGTHDIGLKIGDNQGTFTIEVVKK
jgi:large subunit ribosomal protein L9